MSRAGDVVVQPSQLMLDAVGQACEHFLWNILMQPACDHWERAARMRER